MKSLLYILIFIIPFTPTLNPTENINLPITKLIIPILFLVLLIRFFFKKIKLHIDLVFIFLIIFTSFCAISLLKTLELFESFKRLSVFLAFFPLYLIISSELESKDRFKIYKILNLSALLASLGALGIFILQFFVPPQAILKILTQNIFPWLLGQNFSQKIAEYQSFMVNINNLELVRANLFFPDPHTQGFFLGMIMPISYFLYQHSKKIFYLGSTFIIGLAIVLGFARGSYISLLLTFFLVSFCYFIKHKPKIRINFKVIIVIIGVLSAIILNAPFYNRFLQSFNLTEGSTKQRLYLANQALDLAKDNLFWGIGLANYALSQKKVLNQNLPPTNFHNSYLEILVETGLINLLVFLALLVISITTSIHLNNSPVLMSLLFFSIYAFFETIIYSHQVVPLLMIILAILALNRKKPLRLNPSH